MTGTPIEMYVAIHLPPMVVRDACMQVMHAVEDGDPRYKALTLSMELNVPGGGAVTVPVAAHIVKRPDRWECAVRIEAAKSDKFFPTFDGTLSVTPDGGHEAELWLQGSYVPPGGIVGKGLDVTVMRGIAEKSLRNFLEWLAKEVSSEAERAERERADQARRYHG